MTPDYLLMPTGDLLAAVRGLSNPTYLELVLADRLLEALNEIDILQRDLPQAARDLEASTHGDA